MKPYGMTTIPLFLFLLLLVIGTLLWEGYKGMTAPAVTISARLTKIESDVRYQELDSTEFKNVLDSLIVSSGTDVKTSETGRALVESPGNTTTIVDHNAELTIVLQGENKTTIKLASGNLWSRVEKLFEKGEFYEIETQNAVASVRGTSFGASFKDRVMTIFVEEGIVTVEQIDPETRMRLPETIVTIHEGKKAIIRQKKVITITNITDEDRNSEWYRFNNNDTPIRPLTDNKQTPVPLLDEKPTGTGVLPDILAPQNTPQETSIFQPDSTKDDSTPTIPSANNNSSSNFQTSPLKQTANTLNTVPYPDNSEESSTTTKPDDSKQESRNKRILTQPTEPTTDVQ